MRCGPGIGGLFRFGGLAGSGLGQSHRLGEGHGGLEQIPVDVQPEGAALELCQAAGDGQAQAGALGGAGLFPRTNRSISCSGGMLSCWREMFFTDRVTMPSQHVTSR